MEPTQIAPPGEALKAFLAGLGIDSPQLRFSLPVYSLSLAAVRKKSEAPRLDLVGWQFLTIDAQQRFVVGEVPNAPDGAGGLTSSLGRGFTIDNAWKAYDEVLAQHKISQGGFVLRRLRMSALKIDAFWLKATPTKASGAGDQTLDGKTAPATDSLSAADYVYSFLAFQQQLKSKLVPALDFVRLSGVWPRSSPEKIHTAPSPSVTGKPKSR